MNTAVNYLKSMLVSTDRMTNVADYEIVNRVNKPRRKCS